jgi:hypothetical protein
MTESKILCAYFAPRSWPSKARSTCGPINWLMMKSGSMLSGKSGVDALLSSTLSYIDTFWLLGVTTGIIFFLSFLLRSNHPQKADAQALAH